MTAEPASPAATSVEPCFECDGSGWREDDISRDIGMGCVERPCFVCGGSGELAVPQPERVSPGSASSTDGPEYRCVNGHDRCNQMYPGPSCPYCERVDAPRQNTAAPEGSA